MQLGPWDPQSVVLTGPAVFENKTELNPGGIRKARSTGMGCGTGGHGARRGRDTAVLQHWGSRRSRSEPAILCRYPCARDAGKTMSSLGSSRWWAGGGEIFLSFL